MTFCEYFVEQYKLQSSLFFQSHCSL